MKLTYSRKLIATHSRKLIATHSRKLIARIAPLALILFLPSSAFGEEIDYGAHESGFGALRPTSSPGIPGSSGSASLHIFEDIRGVARCKWTFSVSGMDPQTEYEFSVGNKGTWNGNTKIGRLTTNSGGNGIATGWPCPSPAPSEPYDIMRVRPVDNGIAVGNPMLVAKNADLTQNGPQAFWPWNYSSGISELDVVPAHGIEGSSGIAALVLDAFLFTGGYMLETHLSWSIDVTGMEAHTEYEFSVGTGGTWEGNYAIGRLTTDADGNGSAEGLNPIDSLSGKGPFDIMRVRRVENGVATGGTMLASGANLDRYDLYINEAVGDDTLIEGLNISTVGMNLTFRNGLYEDVYSVMPLFLNFDEPMAKDAARRIIRALGKTAATYEGPFISHDNISLPISETGAGVWIFEEDGAWQPENDNYEPSKHFLSGQNPSQQSWVVFTSTE